MKRVTRARKDSLSHAFQMSEHTVLDPLLVVRLVCSITVVNQAAQIAKLVDEAVEFRDVVRDIPHAYRSTSCQAKALQGVCGMDQKMARNRRGGAEELTRVHLL